MLKGSAAAGGGALIAACSKKQEWMDPGPARPNPGRRDAAPEPPDDPMTEPMGTVDAGAPDAAGPKPDGATPPKPDAAPPEPGPGQPAENHPPEFPVARWLRDARVAGMDGSLDPPEIAQLMDSFAAQGVSVVELDSRLSYYLTDAEFEEEAMILDAAAKAAHERGMKAVIYFPTLEVLSPQAAVLPTMAKDHPDWLQIDMRGMPNKFIGGEGRVFWVEKGTESAWLCPNGPYADYFAGRVARLARTALDGLWGDVPLFADIAAIWPCTCGHCRTKFAADTGLALPAAVNFDDPTFRRWVIWRHKVIHDYEQKILARARAARADFEVIIETVSMDYSSATVQGLDGASHDDGNVLRVWEVDAVSDKSAMRGATREDWLDMAVMMKHGAGCSAPRPSWVFCYGELPDDAERVFALALATGNNPFELKIPIMTETVGASYRQRVYNWLKGEEALYAGYPYHQVAVLYSSASRDFLDRNGGVGLYSSLNPADPLWWSTQPEDLAARLPYVADYRGWSRALIHAHVPFDVLPASRVTPEGLARYKALVVPSAVALSDATIARLKDFTAAGGILLASGGDAGSFDENGRARGNPALLAALGLAPGAAWQSAAHGKGMVAYGNERAGGAYLRGESQRALMEIGRVMPNKQIVTNAPAATVFGVRRTRDRKLVLAVCNLDGLGTNGNTFTPRDAGFDVGLALDGWKATSVIGSAPGAARAPLTFTMKDGRVQFALRTSTISVVTIALG